MDAVEQVSDELEPFRADVFHVLDNGVLLLPAALPQPQEDLCYQLVVLPQMVDLPLQLVQVLRCLHLYPALVA